MINVMIVFGTRPEAIKLLPIIKELEKRKETNPIVCITAQHREMLDQILTELKITPQYDLNIMKNGQTLSEMTAKILTRLDGAIKEAQPDIILVHGDTTTTFVSSLVAYYNMIPIAHIEAGLRTYNKYAPYPEEMNRQMVSVLADLHFSPTPITKNNLLQEHKNLNDIYVTGNTAIDALKLTVKQEKTLDDGKKIVLLTTHRRENLGASMKNIFRAIKRIAEEFKDELKVIYPIHKNPLIREIAKNIIADQENIEIIEPLDVIEFHNLMNQSYLILTDSGGIQEEAPALGKPVLVLRNITERPEGIEAGTLKLVGTDEEKIYSETKKLLVNKEEYDKMANSINPYGDGLASKRIVDTIIERFENRKN